MLIVSELGEALEADRHGKEISQDDMDYLWSIKDKPEFIHEFKARGKDTYTDEIADTFIRLFDLCGGQGIDIERQIELKMKFNEARERLNGKKY
jgi:NTP pyrophosphatase (non-canonical NTP hydrolase)